ncbi:MAG: leucine-rich repeat domain-containing protein [Candidatus Paracaedibacteraceae bacterium]|nr:leucine-rich repeat domain-containing protein [Candidatus Paracaedibacteraceae bacterium]
MNKITSTLLILLAMGGSSMAMQGAGSAADPAAMDIERPTYVELSSEEKNKLIDELQQLLGNGVPLDRQKILDRDDLNLQDKFKQKSADEKNRILLKISEMRWLKTLYLSNNHLRQVPDSIGNLTRLQWLTLSDNHLRQVPEWISNLTQLRTLALSRNQLTSMPPEIANLTRLHTLTLISNPLTSVPATLSDIHTLTELYMENLPNLLLTGPSPDQWGRQEILRHFGDRVRGLSTPKALQVMPSTTTETEVYTALDQQPIRINRDTFTQNRLPDITVDHVFDIHEILQKLTLILTSLNFTDPTKPAYMEYETLANDYASDTRNAQSMK